MATKKRASVLKRQREARKRERQIDRAAKLESRRERRAREHDADQPASSGSEVQGRAELDESTIDAGDADKNAPAPGPGAIARGTATPESGR